MVIRNGSTSQQDCMVPCIFMYRAYTYVIFHRAVECYVCGYGVPGVNTQMTVMFLKMTFGACYVFRKYLIFVQV